MSCVNCGCSQCVSTRRSKQKYAPETTPDVSVYHEPCRHCNKPIAKYRGGQPLSNCCDYCRSQGKL